MSFISIVSACRFPQTRYKSLWKFLIWTLFILSFLSFCLLTQLDIRPLIVKNILCLGVIDEIFSEGRIYLVHIELTILLLVFIIHLLGCEIWSTKFNGAVISSLHSEIKLIFCHETWFLKSLVSHLFINR